MALPTVVSKLDLPHSLSAWYAVNIQTLSDLKPVITTGLSNKAHDSHATPGSQPSLSLRTPMVNMIFYGIIAAHHSKQQFAFLTQKNSDLLECFCLQLGHNVMGLAFLQPLIILCDTCLDNDTFCSSFVQESLSFVISKFVEMVFLGSLQKILVQKRRNHSVDIHKYGHILLPGTGRYMVHMMYTHVIHRHILLGHAYT